MSLRLENKKRNLPKKGLPDYTSLRKIKTDIHNLFSKKIIIIDMPWNFFSEIKHLFGINTQKHIHTDKLKVYAYHLSTSKTFNHQKCALVGTWLICYHIQNSRQIGP